MSNLILQSTKFSKKYDLPHINPHKFRHTQVSLLIGAGIDIVTVSKRVGHKDPHTTASIYAHVLSKADAEANKAIDDILFKKKA